MKGYEPHMSFTEEALEVYGDAERGDEVEAVAFLEEHAGSGPALELAIGTGRIALPLAARGIQVDGIDISPAMIARLRAKPGGQEIRVTMGDFADVGVDGDYPLVYVVFNTLFNLLTQDDQVRCFENVAEHLTDDGVFVIEAYPPSWLTLLDNDQYVRAESIELTSVKIDMLRHDVTRQTIEESHVSVAPDGVRLIPVVQRYSWPGELDLMARIAGLRLHERWGGWKREPYTSTSETLVSVYGR
jgi:SAM-dependent methyltransferase